MCKACTKKLSLFFSDRRSSTIAEIKEQLAYREENKKAVATFNVTRTLGGNTKVLLDEDAGKFIVPHSRKWQEENPDVIDFSQVTGCDTDIRENKTELKREGKDGMQEGYNPPATIMIMIMIFMSPSMSIHNGLMRLNSGSTRQPLIDVFPRNTVRRKNRRMQFGKR